MAGASASRTTSEGILAALGREKVDQTRPRDPIYVGPSYKTIRGKTVYRGPQDILGQGLMAQTQLDTRASDALAADALRTGPSAWRGLMDQQMGLKYSGMSDQLAQQQAGQLGQARSALAMRGGLRGGSAERLATQGMQQGLLERQRMARQRAEEGMGYNIQDELNRQQQVQALGQMDLQRAQFGQSQEQFNIGNTLAELARKNAFDLDRYRSAMQEWGARATAAAMK